MKAKGADELEEKLKIALLLRAAGNDALDMYNQRGESEKGERRKLCRNNKNV